MRSQRNIDGPLGPPPSRKVRGPPSKQPSYRSVPNGDTNRDSAHVDFANVYGSNSSADVVQSQPTPPDPRQSSRSSSRLGAGVASLRDRVSSMAGGGTPSDTPAPSPAISHLMSQKRQSQQQPPPIPSRKASVRMPPVTPSSSIPEEPRAFGNSEKSNKKIALTRPETFKKKEMATAEKLAKQQKDHEETGKQEKKKKEMFLGRHPLQYGLWAHRMGYLSALFCIVFGAFAVTFSRSETYGCKVDDKLIHVSYLYNNQGICPSQYLPEGAQLGIDVCCDQTVKASTLGVIHDTGSGTALIGVIYICYSILIVLVEDVTFGFGYGMWFPSNNWCYDNRISPWGILHTIVGICGLSNLATCLAGFVLILNGGVYFEAMRRQEAGDGGRAAAKKQAERVAENKKKEAEKAGKNGENDDEPDFSCDTCTSTWQRSPLCTSLCTGTNALCQLVKLNPLSQLYRIWQEDKLSAYFWATLFVLANVVMFGVTYQKWVDIIEKDHASMIDGTMDVKCSSRQCDLNRITIQNGPISFAAPLAKACGGCLNMDCALLLVPVIKALIAHLNNLAGKFQDLQNHDAFFSKFFSYSFARYVPIQKNIEFHKMCAFMVCLMTCGHVLGHYANLVYAYDITMAYFEKWGWKGTAFLTGAVILLAMFVIFSAAADIIRHTKYEIFFKAHHCFILFYIFLFLHGPVFWYWGTIPVFFYALDRYRQTKKGRKPFLVTKVEFIDPVMALYFKPVFSKDFAFKEGQYLMLNCPAINETEWHPFTISSAQDDACNGPRVFVETGEEVLDVPRPSNLHADAKWNKYYLVSQNWKDLNPVDYIDKSDTAYNDYISCHIKIHGLVDDKAKTWTRKFKEYLEVEGGTFAGANQFPIFFNSKDHRGDLRIGQTTDRNDLPMIRVDGPHSAPSEHFVNYGTCMMVGGGIGLTPCASVITALIRHRWKNNLNPEILHLYWVVRQGDVDSFQWLVHLLTELSFDFKKSRESGEIPTNVYCEFNIFITAVDKEAHEPKPYQKAKRRYNSGGPQPHFSADKLYDLMLNPTVSSKKMVDTMKRGGAAVNRLQDVWVWNGRPDWNQIFMDVAEQRQHSEIGVCFCGAPVIGNDLKKMCQRYSSRRDDCFFTLHKENF